MVKEDGGKGMVRQSRILIGYVDESCTTVTNTTLSYVYAPSTSLFNKPVGYLYSIDVNLVPPRALDEE